MTADLVEKLIAERDALYHALARLVSERKGIEFATPQQQASLRNAKALLVEVTPAHDKDGNPIRRERTR